MKNVTIFDLLVVYNGAVATSAASTKTGNIDPFALDLNRAKYNVCYAYFLQECAANNIKAAFTTSLDIVGAGECSSYWILENDTWVKVLKPGYSKFIFDKFSPRSKIQRGYHATLFSNPEIKPFNNPKLASLFFDKQKTFNDLQAYAIPTVSIQNNTDECINTAVKTLKNLIALHPHRADFSDKFVLKDRYGAGGNNIYSIDKKFSKITLLMKQNQKTSFILQPFTKFDKGYAYKNVFAYTDIRMIYLGGKMIQSYIRVAKKQEFRCNEHQGGTLTFTLKKDIPKNVMNYSNEISKILNSKSSLYALDFIVSNNDNVYFLEGNTNPGINWNAALPKSIKMHKVLIDTIVKNIASKVHGSPITIN